MALQFEARKVALKQDRTGYVLTLSLHPDEIPEELLRDLLGLGTVVRLSEYKTMSPLPFMTTASNKRQCFARLNHSNSF